MSIINLLNEGKENLKVVLLAFITVSLKHVKLKRSVLQIIQVSSYESKTRTHVPLGYGR